MGEAVLTQPISLGEKARRGLWWRFLNLFSGKKPELPTTVQSEEKKTPEVPSRSRQSEGAFPKVAEDGSTQAMQIEEQPVAAKKIDFDFISQAMKGEGSITYERRKRDDPTTAIGMFSYSLLITTSTKDKKIKELMPAKGSKEPLTMKQARASSKAPTHFLIKPNEPKTLFIFGTNPTADVIFRGVGSASIGDFSADLWAGVNDRGELEYFFRVHEPSWCYDEATQRCLTQDESIPIIPGQMTEFWVGRVGVGDDLTPAFSMHIKIQEQ